MRNLIFRSYDDETDTAEILHRIQLEIMLDDMQPRKIGKAIVADPFL